MAKRKQQNNVNNESSFFSFTIEKKKKLIGIFLILFALLLLLSILSYSEFDQANLTYGFTDLFRVFSSDPEFIQRAESTHNWLGIFGAYVSDFFVNSTIGYFAVVFPVILFIWGYSVLKRESFKLAVHLTNFLVIIGIILASFFGVLRFELDIFVELNELSGNIGSFLGAALGRLLGGLGSIILLITLFFVSLMMAFDIKFTGLIEFVKDFWNDAFTEDESNITAEKPEDSKVNKNLKKIKDLRKPKQKEEKAEAGNQEVDGSEDEKTKIRIVRKDEEETVTAETAEEAFEESKENKEDEKKKDKSDDEIIPSVDKEKEEKLPDQWEETLKFNKPNVDFLDVPEEEENKISEFELTKNAELLKDKLALFDIEIEDISVTPGPVVTLYEIVPAPGVKIARIVSLEHDIALALAARGIRIIAPIPGKSAIGVEIPNSESAMVHARSIIPKLKETKAELPLAFGKTIIGDVYIADLATMPHLLIAGSTGSGKSVGINMIITSLLYTKHPSDIKFAIIDPKKIELSFYQKLNKHFLAVSPDLDEEIVTNPQNALLLLKAVELEMEKRYDKLAKAGVRNIVDYNKKVTDPKRKPADTEKMKHHKIPYIIVIIDELADLMMTSGKEVEAPIARLAQLARAVGIHLIVATQRPSVNVITGVIKANFSARIAYQVATKIDSRTILDMNGAEQLLGRGDMLFLPGGMPKPIRIQNAFISTEEVEKITNHIYVQQGYSKRFLLPSMFDKATTTNASMLTDLDPMFKDAAQVIVSHQQGSVSLLQRRLKLGYARAARIVDQLEQAGVVGQADGSKAREVLVETEEDLETILRSL